MALPEYDRVLFRKAPLKLVVGQVRFPVLPRFAADGFIAPLAEALRSDYPRLSREYQQEFQLTPQGMQQKQGDTLWRLSTRDKSWSVVVAETALTLEVSQYLSIGEFLPRLERALEAAKTYLDVSERSRLGLRYVNELRHPDAQTLDGWAKLLRPEFVGFEASDLLEGRVEQSIQHMRVARPDGTLAIRHGLLNSSSSQVGEDQSSAGDPFYLIDLDYYDDTECELDVVETIDQVRHYNDTLYRFFRWTLSEQLFEVLEPTNER
jgi:uncharacterized protein (TIGR04255 family)